MIVQLTSNNAILWLSLREGSALNVLSPLCLYDCNSGYSIKEIICFRGRSLYFQSGVAAMICSLMPRQCSPSAEQSCYTSSNSGTSITILIWPTRLQESKILRNTLTGSCQRTSFAVFYLCSQINC